VETKAHWNRIYATKPCTQVSWYQQHLEVSLHLIERTGIDKTAHIIDVGGGASTLVEDLLVRGFQQVTVLDISAAALRAAQERIGCRAASVEWLEADITEATLPANDYDLWHDRATFHFLTRIEDRRKYIEAVRHSVKEQGHIIIATFADDGPTRCSGLDVVRYSSSDLRRELGGDFKLVDSVREDHRTPFGTVQSFVYCWCTKESSRT
jgi:ubiquinone/menaquinone biosynthesis C-methylase UbiE